MASELQMNRLPGLLAIKMVWELFSFANRLAHQSTTSTNKRWQWRTQAEHSRLKSGPPLMRRLGIHKNIPVSGTKLMLGLQVGFISSHLTADKPFLVNSRAITGPPKMSLQLEAKSMPALIIKPKLILGLYHRLQVTEYKHIYYHRLQATEYKHIYHRVPALINNPRLILGLYHRLQE